VAASEIVAASAAASDREIVPASSGVLASVGVPPSRAGAAASFDPLPFAPEHATSKRAMNSMARRMKSLQRDGKHGSDRFVHQVRFAVMLLAAAACSSGTAQGPLDAGDRSDAGSPVDGGRIDRDATSAGFDAEAKDASGPALDAMSPDAVVRDGASDAAPVDAATSRYCDQYPHARLCADFDDGRTASAFDQTFQLGTQITVDTSTSTSQPGSLEVSAPAGLSEALGFERRFATSRTPTISCAFDLRIDAAGTATTAGTAFDVVYTGQTTNDFFTISLQIGLSGSSVTETNTNFGQSGVLVATHPISPPLPIGRWTRVSVIVTSGPPALTVKVDGSTVVDRVRLFQLANIQGGLSSIDVGLGFKQSSATGAWEGHFDDVLCL
jgi:hypothetical protein